MEQVINFFAAADLPVDKIRQLLRLKAAIWPTKLSSDEQLDEFRHLTTTRDNRKLFIAELDGEIVSHAEVFERRIYFTKNQLTVGCLAGVCVAPAHRRRGLGTKISTNALQLAAHSRKDGVVLFQTNIPKFYLRLGCRIVFNKFTNYSVDNKAQCPWWQPHIMIFPSHYNWPNTPIDLNGPGF